MIKFVVIFMYCLGWIFTAALGMNMEKLRRQTEQVGKPSKEAVQGTSWMAFFSALLFLVATFTLIFGA